MKPKYFIAQAAVIVALLGAVVLSGCAPKSPYLPEATGQMRYSSKYKIGPGDSLSIFVWRYPEVSTTVSVRSDGFITANLLEDVPAAGKTPTELARDLERELSVYLRDPLVSVIVGGGKSIYSEQIRVVGEGSGSGRGGRAGGAYLYTDGMTLLDLFIQTGGISEYADGNSTVLLRVEEGQQRKYTVRVDDLVRDADFSANIDLRPGDILIVPESWF